MVPAEDAGTGGQTAAEGCEQQKVAVPDFPGLHRFRQREGGRGRGGVAGMVDVDAVAQAVDILQQVSLIPTKELSSIIKDSQAQQLRIGGMEAEHVPVQITFGDAE